MKISVRVHEVYDNENSKVKGIASASFGGQFAVHGIRIIDGKKGLFASMPSRMNDEGEPQPLFHAITTDSYHQLNNAVVKAYEQKLEEIANSEEETEGENQSEDDEQSEDDGEDFEEIEEVADDLGLNMS